MAHRRSTEARLLLQLAIVALGAWNVILLTPYSPFPVPKATLPPQVRRSIPTDPLAYYRLPNIGPYASVPPTFPANPLPPKLYTFRTSPHEIELEKLEDIAEMEMGEKMSHNVSHTRHRPYSVGASGESNGLDWNNILPHKTGEVYVPLPNSKTQSSNPSPISSSPPTPGSEQVDPAPYVPTIFHSLHCLDMIRSSLFSPPSNDSNDTESDPESSMEHDVHCFNYIRQMILCQADTTLEEMPSQVDSEVVGAESLWIRRYGKDKTRVCRDWDVLFDAVGENWRSGNASVEVLGMS